MTREPFAETIEDDLYYAEPGRQQKLDILLHLTQYGNELVLVSGPTGSGKTTLLQQYLLKALDNWSVAHIDAAAGIDERKLLQQLFHQLGMEFQGATHSELFERMQHHFDALQHSARQAVLIIDNAEQLPVTAIKRILEMAALTSADNKPLLRVILLGDITLYENFDDPLLDSFDHLVRRNVELLPFEQEQTTHYILHRLSAANFSADKPFTDTVLHKIHKQSNGLPAEINRLAHDVLIETLPTPGNNSDKHSNVKVLRMIGAFSGIALVAALLIFQDEFNAILNPAPQLATSPQIASPAEPVLQTTQSEQTVTPADAAPPATADAAQEIAHQPTETHLGETQVSESPATEAQTTTVPETETASTHSPGITADADVLPTETDAPDTTVATPAATPHSVETSHTETEPKPVVTTTKKITATKFVKSPVSTSTSPAIPDDLPGFRSTWIFSQDPSHYTLQLVAGNNIKTLRSFIRRHKPAGPLAIYSTTRKGKPWYGLIQKSYPGKQAAIDGRSQLPPSLRRKTPWVRTFASLQKDLHKTP